jgi:hypothetical protein
MALCSNLSQLTACASPDVNNTCITNSMWLRSVCTRLLDCRLLLLIDFNFLNLKLVFQVMGFGKIHECLELMIEE